MVCVGIDSQPLFFHLHFYTVFNQKKKKMLSFTFCGLNLKKNKYVGCAFSDYEHLVEILM